MKQKLMALAIFAILTTSVIANEQTTEPALQKISGRDFKSSLVVAPSNGNYPEFIGFSRDRAYMEIRDDNDRSMVVAIQWTFIKDLDDNFIADIKQRLEKNRK